MDMNQKLLMIHADDAGLSHSQNRATMACLKEGMVNSYSIMVPCPGFDEIATFAKANPNYDYGIHLTLTCEWHNCRFGPTSPLSAVQSLVDGHGHFHKTRQELKEYGKAAEVYTELKAQIERALDFGLRPSHLDSHMYSIGASPQLFAIYKKLGQEYQLPVLLNKKLIQMAGLKPNHCLNDTDFCIDHVYLATFDDFKKGHLKSRYLEIVDQLAPGLNVLLIHPAFDDDEMKALTVDHPNFGSEWRQMDYDSFVDGETRSKLLENKVKLVSWKEITQQFTT